MKFDNCKKSADEVLEHLQSDVNGISAEEAAARLAANGKNKLAEGKKISLARRFLNQILDPMIIVLLGAAILSAITSIYSHESFADVFIILFVVIMNAVLGVIQESKAEQAIEALKEMTLATTKVIRSGQIEEIPSEDLVVGDVIILEAGDVVPADARVLESMTMQSEEAALTGESLPVDKTSDVIASGQNDERDIPLGDRRNMVFMGCTIVYGRGKAVVTATGMDTQMGNIANALAQAEDEATPLQVKLAQLSKILTYIVLIICALIFVFGLIKEGQLNSNVVLDTFMLAVSLAVAAIPEGLVAVVTIVLTIGVTRMSRRNAVIRRLTAVETLGCTQIICSDKTGTLTQNKMTVVDSFTKYDDPLLMTAMSLCSDAEPDAEGRIVGEPTEVALVEYAEKGQLMKTDLTSRFPRVGEAPFDSMRKMMSTVHTADNSCLPAGFEEGALVQFTKGAPDVLLKKCRYYLDSNGTALPMNEDILKEIAAENSRMADQALRVLAAAYRKHSSMPDSFASDELEQDLVFIGLTGMIDPVRPEVKIAIDKCKEAGIRPIMITGDHKATAVAIANSLGINEGTAITGTELNELSDDELNERIKEFSVYARVQPEHKVRIVNAWKSQGMIVAMTGDGVNDAPSIKAADIGVGMGITGTDVTKNVADMILADDNFATIVSAVEEGRKIYSNIRKSIQFLLSSNLSEVLSIFIATLLGFTILKPAHMLWINLITDCFPALALGMENNEPDTMKIPPRKASEGIFANGVGIDILYQGVLVTLLTLSAYFIGDIYENFDKWQNGTWVIEAFSRDGITMAFITMSLTEIFQSFNMRSQRNSIFSMKSHNMFLYGSAILAIILTTIVIYVPFLRDAFEFEAISFNEYAIAFGLAILIIPLVELVKLCQRRSGRKK